MLVFAFCIKLPSPHLFICLVSGDVTCSTIVVSFLHQVAKFSLVVLTWSMGMSQACVVLFDACCIKLPSSRPGCWSGQKFEGCCFIIASSRQDCICYIDLDAWIVKNLIVLLLLYQVAKFSSVVSTWLLGVSQV